MSFRHTYVTEFLYKSGRQEELDAIRNCLEKYGTAEWIGRGMEGLGYFHGIIKDLDSYETKNMEKEIIEDVLKNGARIAIVFE